MAETSRDEAIPRNTPARISLYLGVVPPLVGLAVLLAFVGLDRNTFGAIMIAFAAGGGPCFMLAIPGFGLYQGIRGWRLSAGLAGLGRGVSITGIVLNSLNLAAFVIWAVVALN